MVKRIAFPVLVAASFLLPTGLSARQEVWDRSPNYELTQYAVPAAPGVAIVAVYAVNGVNYPMDQFGRLWGQNLATGSWQIIGRIIQGPYGPVAVDLNNNTYPAVRVQ
jgi:hypothetical protein